MHCALKKQWTLQSCSMLWWTSVYFCFVLFRLWTFACWVFLNIYICWMLCLAATLDKYNIIENTCRFKTLQAIIIALICLFISVRYLFAHETHLHWDYYCCDRKSRMAFAQSFALWQQATIEIMLAISLTIACSCYIYNGFILHAHPIRGESHNQCNTTGEVATTSPPFYNEPHRPHVLCVKAELGTTSTFWSQHHFVAIGNPEWHVHKASHCGNKQQ